MTIHPPALVFKICPETIWREAEKEGAFHGSGIDLEDGYIHFSTSDQVAETAWLHFNGVEGLMLVAVATDKVALTWEGARGGVMFPHLYASLGMDQVLWAVAIPLGDNGQHVFPETIPPFTPDPSA